MPPFEISATRESLLRGSIEKVEMRWVRARELGAERPAVLLLDPCDSHARAILETSGEATRIEAAVATGARRGLAPVFSWGLPREVAQELVRAEFGTDHDIVGAETGDGYPAVVVAEGGVSLFVMPPVPA